MTSRFMNNWIVIQSKDSHYADIEGRCYEYLSHIPNAQRVKPGDVLIISLPKSDATEGRRIIGLAHIGQIRKGKEGRFVAYYDRYLECVPLATFDEIGGDPRSNPNNSINKVNPKFVEKLLQREGLSSIEDIPFIILEEEEGEIPPEHKLREELYQAVTNDLLGPAGGPEEEIVGTSVRDRYLVGKLAPKKVISDEAAAEERNRGGEQRTEDGEAEEGGSAHESLMPSSFGMTFCIDAEVPLLGIEVNWGRYVRKDSESVVDKDGKPKKAWKRSSPGGKTELKLVSGPFGPLAPDSEHEGIFLNLTTPSKGFLKSYFYVFCWIK